MLIEKAVPTENAHNNLRVDLKRNLVKDFKIKIIEYY